MSPGRAERGPEWLLIDGSSLIFRAYYGVPQSVRSPDGRPVNAVRGFLDLLARLIAERRPRRVLVARDDDWRPAFRVELIPSYKAHRVAEPIPPGLAPQMPVVMEILDALGLPSVGMAGFEAEDVIASVLARVTGPVEIVSGDRDLFALIRDPDVKVLYPEGKGQFRVFDEAEVGRRYGIPGRAYADFAILRGDPSDGLPGLPGVGDRKAADLVRTHGGLTGLVATGILAPTQVEYLARATRVVVPESGLPLPELGDRILSWPTDDGPIHEMESLYGLGGPLGRLRAAIDTTSGTSS
ncbi:MAG: 5'-3' exonuclease [Candidatus Dormibacterales bacterium]